MSSPRATTGSAEAVSTKPVAGKKRTLASAKVVHDTDPIVVVAARKKNLTRVVGMAAPRKGWNPGRNLWRFQAGSNEKIIEILLQSDHIALIDAHRYDEIAPYRWVASEPHKEHPYVTGGITVDGIYKMIALHIFLFPNIEVKRDHRNRNPLDNRAENLRTGANGMNERNVDSVGVVIYEASKICMAQWTEFGADTQSTKSFSWSEKAKMKYASQEAAYAAAEIYAKKQSAIAMAKVEAHNAEHGGLVPIPRLARSHVAVSNTGIKGLHIDKDDRLHAHVAINWVRYANSWALSSFETKEAAYTHGQQWLDAIKTAHPKKKGAPRHKKSKVAESYTQ